MSRHRLSSELIPTLCRKQEDKCRKTRTAKKISQNEDFGSYLMCLDRLAFIPLASLRYFAVEEGGIQSQALAAKQEDVMSATILSCV